MSALCHVLWSLSATCNTARDHKFVFGKVGLALETSYPASMCAGYGSPQFTASLCSATRSQRYFGLMFRAGCSLPWLQKCATEDVLNSHPWRIPLESLKAGTEVDAQILSKHRFSGWLLAHGCSCSREFFLVPLSEFREEFGCIRCSGLSTLAQTGQPFLSSRKLAMGSLPRA